MTSSQNCPFCTLPNDRIIARNNHGIVVRDACPVSVGHTLIIPIRHIGSFFELAADERAGMLDLLETSKSQLDRAYSPDAFNIGINDRPDASQTVRICISI